MGDKRHGGRERYDRFSKKFDPKCQEATPEDLRIEIDDIFKQFMGDPEQKKFIFPTGLNNLQRKYIHNKALKLNIISKSFGKEPNRQLHLTKRTNSSTMRAFTIDPSHDLKACLDYFGKNFKSEPSCLPSHKKFNEFKTSCKLLDKKPSVPIRGCMTKEMNSLRQDLPIAAHREIIIEAIHTNKVVIISSETGSGKTTQVPQYILEDHQEANKPCRIICTQPRRISTLAAAQRVAYEREEPVGKTVGFAIRLEHSYNEKCNLVFCTTGVFLRKLMTGANDLRNVTHIIIDEIHERDKLSDFLLICLKQTMNYYPDLRIILMSATVDSSKFVDYFDTGKILHIPGRLFHINTLFLGQILQLLKYMSPKMLQVQNREEYNAKERELMQIFDVFPPPTDSEIDTALDEYMNVSEDYDSVQATAQLSLYFMSEGVPLNYRHSQTGKTALMIATILHDMTFIIQLLCQGASLDIKCNLGKTALDYASDNPNLQNYLISMNKSQQRDKEYEELNKEAVKLQRLYDKSSNDDVIDYELIVALVSYIMYKQDDDGAILIFLPGYDDIMICNDYIEEHLTTTGYKIFFLHGSMSIKDQRNVFKKLPKTRKIILSTNIAETSVTIDDVVFVIDTGKVKEKCYDSYNKVSSLETVWISQACAKQRMGRAGRTRPGVCFRLYSEQRYRRLDAERVPEILRISLEELCLHAKVLAPENMNIAGFLAMAPDPPSANAVKVAIENLQLLGAVDCEELLTDLGLYLSRLTIEPRLGKMLVYSVIFRCLEPVLTLAASMSHKDPFELPPQVNLKTRAAEKRRELIDGVLSDHVLYVQAFNKWQQLFSLREQEMFCRDFCISQNTMFNIRDTRKQLMGQLKAIGFLPEKNNIEQFNKNSNSWPTVKAVICAASYPNVAFMFRPNLTTRNDNKVSIQKNSACYNKAHNAGFIFDELYKNPRNFLIRGVSAVSLTSVVLTCGSVMFDTDTCTINMDNWLNIKCPNKTFIEFHINLEKLVEKVLSFPSHKYTVNDNLIVHTLKTILEAEEVSANLSVPRDIYMNSRNLYRQETNWRSDRNTSNRHWGRGNNELGGIYGPKGTRNNQRGSSGSQRGSSGSLRGSSGNQRGSSGNQRGSSGSQRGSSGNQRGSSGNQRGSSINHQDTSTGTSGNEPAASSSQLGTSNSQSGTSINGGTARFQRRTFRNSRRNCK